MNAADACACVEIQAGEKLFLGSVNGSIDPNTPRSRVRRTEVK